VIKVDLSLLWTIINLVVFYLLLKKFLFKPVMGIMEKREQMIADGLKNASDRQEEAETLKKEYESALSGAKEESVKIVENARVEAKRQSDEILADVKSSEPIKEDGEVLYPEEQMPRSNVPERPSRLSESRHWMALRHRLQDLQCRQPERL
jgi:vacuolar-type H+-ATPase subunit H